MKFPISNFKFLIFVLAGLIWCGHAKAAVLYAGSATQQLTTGQSFVLDWFLDTDGEQLNALDLKIKFSDNLEAQELSDGNSLVSVWLKYPHLAANGLIELAGGVPNGFNGKNAPIFRSTFLAKQSGEARIDVLSSSKVYENDGKGTAASLKFSPIIFEIGKAQTNAILISSPTHPSQDAWYQRKSVKIVFPLKAGLDYSYSFSSNLEIVPDEQKDEWSGEKTFENLPDGIYYFRLNQKQGPSAWQEAGVFRVQIDTAPPEPFEPTIESNINVLEGASLFGFSTVDKVSGISHYDVRIGLLDRFAETKSPIKLKKPLVGDNIQVRAYDYAGNVRAASVVYPGIISVRMFSILLGIIAIIAAWYIWKKIQNKI
ncbi:MAG TPA: hypothetical protein VGQ87_02500 [Patescibacteria group bacterium]|jgi:hypothetical protein|nr:hypothetical protein [Patescibacteria group bacterium]